MSIVRRATYCKREITRSVARTPRLHASRLRTGHILAEVCPLGRVLREVLVLASGDIGKHLRVMSILQDARQRFPRGVREPLPTDR